MYDQHDKYFLPNVFNADSALKTCALQRVSLCTHFCLVNTLHEKSSLNGFKGCVHIFIVQKMSKETFFNSLLYNSFVSILLLALWIKFDFWIGLSIDCKSNHSIIKDSGRTIMVFPYLPIQIITNIWVFRIGWYRCW